MELVLVPRHGARVLPLELVSVPEQGAEIYAREPKKNYVQTGTPGMGIKCEALDP